MATVLEVPINIFGQRKNLVSFSGAGRPPNYACVIRKNKSFVPIVSSSLTPVQYQEEKTSRVSQNFAFPIMIQQIRDPNQQIEMVGVPEEYLSGHAFHMYHLTSPDETVSFEFQHNVCGRSIYAGGSVDAAFFLAKKIRSKADKRLYNMIDVLREGMNDMKEMIPVVFVVKEGKEQLSEQTNKLHTEQDSNPWILT